MGPIPSQSHGTEQDTATPPAAQHASAIWSWVSLDTRAPGQDLAGAHISQSGRALFADSAICILLLTCVDIELYTGSKTMFDSSTAQFECHKFSSRGTI